MLPLQYLLNLPTSSMTLVVDNALSPANPVSSLPKRPRRRVTQRTCSWDGCHVSSNRWDCSPASEKVGALKPVARKPATPVRPLARREAVRRPRLERMKDSKEPSPATRPNRRGRVAPARTRSLDDLFPSNEKPVRAPKRQVSPTPQRSANESQIDVSRKSAFPGNSSDSEKLPLSVTSNVSCTSINSMFSKRLTLNALRPSRNASPPPSFLPEIDRNMSTSDMLTKVLVDFDPTTNKTLKLPSCSKA